MTQEYPTSGHYDTIVVGAGAGGIYAVHRFTEQGLNVLGIEAAAEVGGVWYHNRYPGARVDVESYYYCYLDPKLYAKWSWKERYPAQPEILAYLNFAADEYDVRKHFQFTTWMTGAKWLPDENVYQVSTDSGAIYTCRFLIMTAGQLSKPRRPQFEGLDSFEGEWVQTSTWPDRPVETVGKRIAVVGTGSSGVQVIPELAKDASQLYVMQRTPNYSVPARNQPIDEELLADIAGRVDDEWQAMLSRASGAGERKPFSAATELTVEEQREALEVRWAAGGHNMNAVFADQGRNFASNEVVAEFVREKVRGIVNDSQTAKKLLPTSYPIGSRRLCVDNGYYETFNRENVTLVDVAEDPIERITPHGIKTRDGEYEVDLIVFALGFEAFTGAIRNANITNEFGAHPTDRWERGPRTFLGLMTAGFPNLFFVTGPGSPSVLANMIAGNQFHIDYISEIIDHMKQTGAARIEPEERAEEAWNNVLQEHADRLIRKQVQNYMVHVNDDGSRVFIPYSGGLHTYVEHCRNVAEKKYEGFAFA